AARGFQVVSAASDWVVPARGFRLHPLLRLRRQRFLTHLVLGHAAAAERQVPRQLAALDAWGMARLPQITARLAVRIGHRDLLALPPAR
ncbi:MAG TPA: hypothetical protein VE684_18580, partial [Crenalkalicoccus sp.]|nr:hypothetical protein [Crenalkalicoccus sp.]